MFEILEVTSLSMFYSIYWWIWLIGLINLSYNWMFPKPTHRLYYVGGCLLCVPRNAIYPIIYKRETL